MQKKRIQPKYRERKEPMSNDGYITNDFFLAKPQSEQGRLLGMPMRGKIGNWASGFAAGRKKMSDLALLLEEVAERNKNVLFRFEADDENSVLRAYADAQCVGNLMIRDMGMLRNESTSKRYTLTLVGKEAKDDWAEKKKLAGAAEKLALMVINLEKEAKKKKE